MKDLLEKTSPYSMPIVVVVLLLQTVLQNINGFTASPPTIASDVRDIKVAVADTRDRVLAATQSADRAATNQKESMRDITLNLREATTQLAKVAITLDNLAHAIERINDRQSGQGP